VASRAVSSPTAARMRSSASMATTSVSGARGTGALCASGSVRSMPVGSIGLVTMKMIISTIITSTSGVRFISAMGWFGG